MSYAVQHTLADSATLEGTSLHTGEKVTLTIKPAPEDYGFKFRRIDLDDQPFIKADVDKVQTVERATTLAEGSVKVHTVEHVLSALTGMGVDNALIEMDANEPPIGDGSSQPFVELIKKVGITPQNKPRANWEIREPIYFETKDVTNSAKSFVFVAFFGSLQQISDSRNGCNTASFDPCPDHFV